LVADVRQSIGRRTSGSSIGISQSIKKRRKGVVCQCLSRTPSA
jgi:hypothetical protein